MNREEQICSIALSLCEGIGHIGAKRLVESVGSATEVFAHRKELPSLIPDIRPAVIEALDNQEAFRRAEEELQFAETHGIQCLTLKDEVYPSRLRECEDAPIMLFFQGNIDFNRLHIVAMVGTRHATNYGCEFCAEFIRDLAACCPDAIIVSGLAYGIDIHSHREAQRNNLSTVAVLAHGLDRIYPYVHRQTAQEIQANGGLLTEFLTHTNPDRQNFVQRNRIVAGISDAVIVVESAAKGGSLITAGLATDYNRDCFAVPGRRTDAFSIGCNQLIRDNKAQILLNAEDFVKAMNWDTPQTRVPNVQRTLFLDFTPEEERIIQILTKRGDLHINALVVEAGIPVNRMSVLLFELEMKGVIRSNVGGSYHLIG